MLLRLTLLGLLIFGTTVSFAQTDSLLIDEPIVVSMNCRTGEDYEFRPTLKNKVVSGELIVYNRWGAILFHSEEPDPMWYAGKEKEGYYFYTYRGMYVGGVGFDVQGRIYVLK